MTLPCQGTVITSNMPGFWKIKSPAVQVEARDVSHVFSTSNQHDSLLEISLVVSFGRSRIDFPRSLLKNAPKQRARRKILWPPHALPEELYADCVMNLFFNKLLEIKF
jgi:hypothetical protein